MEHFPTDDPQEKNEEDEVDNPDEAAEDGDVESFICGPSVEEISGGFGGDIPYPIKVRRRNKQWHIIDTEEELERVLGGLGAIDVEVRKSA
jgi:hypothetical protein